MPSPFRPRPAALSAALSLATVAASLAAVVPVARGARAAAPSSAPSAPAILTVAGTGTPCAGMPWCGDGGPATAAPLSDPQGVATDARGDVYVVDWGESTVRRIGADGRVSTVAGDGVACQSAPSCGDGGPATAAELSFPTAVAVDARGDVFIADSGDDEIREVRADGTIERIAGTGAACVGAAPCGDGGPARSAQLSGPNGIAVDAHGVLFVADTGDQRIRLVSPAGTITTVAGTGTPCWTAPRCGDGGLAKAATLNFPESVAVDRTGRILVADDGDNEVRQIAGGRISRLAGTGVACASAPGCGDGGRATLAQLTSPQGVAVAANGAVVIADWGDNEVRVVSPQGFITRLAGTGAECGAAASCTGAGTAMSTALDGPNGVTVDGDGDVFIADTFDDAIRLVPALAAGDRAADVLAVLGTTHGGVRGVTTARFALSAPASVTLSVTRSGRPAVTVAREQSAAGLGALTWDGRLAGVPVPRGRYTLTLRAVAARGASAASLVVAL